MIRKVNAAQEPSLGRFFFGFQISNFICVTANVNCRFCVNDGSETRYFLTTERQQTFFYMTMLIAIN